MTKIQAHVLGRLVASEHPLQSTPREVARQARREARRQGAARAIALEAGRSAEAIQMQRQVWAG